MDVRQYIREVARPLLPKPTGVAPKLDRLEGIRVVLFDIYGTLLISDAGDISSNSSERRLRAMTLVSERLGGTADPSMLLEEYEQEVSRQLSRERERGVDFPEVEIRDVWREIVMPHLSEAPAKNLVEEIAIIYECSSNPVWPIPGANEVLAKLRGSGLKLGIVSNAQFYTPLVVEELFCSALSDLGFCAEWLTFSFRLRQGKPSVAIYEESRKTVVKSGFSPAEVLYVGNDMIKDVEPASAVGFKTCLFAGDARSLRLGGGSIDDAKRCADVVITELEQIIDILNVRQ